MIDFIYQWIDVLWLPVAWFVVHKHHRLMALAFIIICMMTMRLQIEIMTDIGRPTGILPWLDSGLFARGLVTYSLIYAVFLALAYFSKSTQAIIFFAAILSIYIFALCLSMIVMVL